MEQKKSKPNIIFLLVDSLRSDKFFSNAKTSPNLKKLLEKGVYFEKAFSASDYTITGYGSIFTGLYPINAGIVGINYHKIFSKNPNFISALKNSGYHTYGIMDSSFFDQEKGIGLANYFENDDQGYERNIENLFSGLDTKILNNLQKLKDPWFYFIHIDDLHLPIKLPENYKNLDYNERYDLVLSKIDSWIGKILDKIDISNTLLIITADHGDYLYFDDDKSSSIEEKIKSKLKNKISPSTYNILSGLRKNTKQNFSKAKNITSKQKRFKTTRTSQTRYLFDDVIHIPLLFVGAKIPGKGSINDLVRNIDICPTLADVIDIKYDFPIDGRSLMPLIQNKNLDEEMIYLENTIFNTDVKSPKPHIGLRTSKYKYFRSMDNDSSKKIYLFDLISDPQELTNIANSNPELTQKFENELQKIRTELQKDFSTPEISDDETKKIEAELKKLGYI